LTQSHRSRRSLFLPPPAICSNWPPATGLRPAEELYLPDDPEQLRNVAGDSRSVALTDELSRRLLDELRPSGDPSLGNDPDIFDRYPYARPKSD
jgi:hypothetical protein